MKYQNLIFPVLLAQTIMLGCLAVQLIDVRTDMSEVSSQLELVGGETMYSPVSSPGASAPAISVLVIWNVPAWISRPSPSIWAKKSKAIKKVKRTNVLP